MWYQRPDKSWEMNELLLQGRKQLKTKWIHSGVMWNTHLKHWYHSMPTLRLESPSDVYRETLRFEDMTLLPHSLPVQVLGRYS